MEAEQRSKNSCNESNVNDGKNEIYENKPKGEEDMYSENINSGNEIYEHDGDCGAKCKRGTSSSLPLGMVLTKNWRGHDYAVKRVEDGYEYDGQVHSSLSAIANIITGARHNGNEFFGVAQATATLEAEANRAELLPGAVIKKNWRGSEYLVSKVADGYEYAGKIFASLTAVANEITGSYRNGKEFFGLQ